jgi:hypothetical protein
VKHIQFFGESSLCSQWLPFAKKKMDSLTRLYGARVYWTWERVIGPVRISLERDGAIEFIRIYAGIRGYEYIAVINKFVVDEENPEPTVDPAVSRFSIAMLAPPPDPNEPVPTPPDEWWLDQGTMIARNRRGTLLKPENDSKKLDRRDKWLSAGRYGFIDPEDDEDTDLGTNLYSASDWFELPVVDTDEAYALADLISGQFDKDRGRILKWYTHRSRNFDLAYWFPLKYPILLAPGLVFSIATSGKSRLTGLTVANSDDDGSGHFPLAGSCAWQGNVLMGASWRGDDFMFEVRSENYRQYYTGSFFFSLTRPGWMNSGIQTPWVSSAAGGHLDVYTPWYWRGDGKRCVSLQYNKYLQPSSSQESDLLDSGFVEAEIIVNQLVHPGDLTQEPPEIPTVASAYFVHQQHNLAEIGINPCAIDYYMLDQRKKRAYYFAPYMGPIRTRGLEPSGFPDPQPEERTSFARDLLVYLVCVEIDDLFPGTEIWRIPVWHGQAWRGYDLIDDDTDPPLPPYLDAIYWGSGFGYPSITHNMDDVDGVPVWDWLDIRGVITAMDARAEAVAIHYQVRMPEPHNVNGNDVEESRWFGKYYRIWRDEEPIVPPPEPPIVAPPLLKSVRQNEWIRPDLTLSPILTDGDYTYLDSVDGLSGEPVLPGDFMEVLSEIPDGYVPFLKGSTYDLDGTQTGLQQLYSTILQQVVYISGGGSPYRVYNGFRVSPTKSFALIANNRSLFQHVNTVYNSELTNALEPWRGVPMEWWVMDHIEQYKGRLSEPATSTHYGLYNATRGKEYPPGEIEDSFATASVNGIWVE